MKAKEHRKAVSFDWAIVSEALRRTIPPEGLKPGRRGMLSKNRSVELSVLINDVFGGEILRSHNGRGWHYYNRIDGECIDLAGQVFNVKSDSSCPGENSDAPTKTSSYIEQNDYTKFFLSFVSAFEETVGLGKYQSA